jgi:predicted component of type VI protein secretion system
MDEKARAERKLNQAIEEYEERLAEMRNNHEEAMNIL